MKDKLLSWLFRSYAKRLKTDYKNQLDLKLDAFKATFDLKDLLRERLKGIRPNHPEDNSILQNHLAGLDDVSRLAFLSKAHDIVNNNNTFKIVVESLIIEQEHHTMLHASDMPEVNFGRASVNGMMLVEEELNRLGNMYITESENNKVLTDEERLSAL